MGPQVDAEPPIQRFVLRPFPTSNTWHNLQRHAQGVLHVTDDVLLLARAAVGRIKPVPPLEPAQKVDGWVLRDACRAYEFDVVRTDSSGERVTIDCEVCHEQRRRDFFGFNRAKHAVLEAAILATRLRFLPREFVRGEFERLARIVEKTAGEQERKAFDFLQAFLSEWTTHQSGR